MGNRFSRARATTPPPVEAAGVPVVVGTEVIQPVATTPSATPAVATTPSATPGEEGTGGNEKAVLPQLDLVFTMDCTGSMGSYIHAAKKNIQAIVAKLVQSEGYDLRFGLISYRDHPPQDQTYVTKKFAFTGDAVQMERDLSTLSAQGGGDGPEAVAAALKETLESKWRPNATKVCVLIADAPPHGLGEPGDGFPEGAPDGVDPFEMLTAMSMRGICIYSVGCEPALSNYAYAKDFFVAAAQRTNGQAVSLRSAAALADVIMGGAIEEMDLQQLADEVIEEVRNMRQKRRAARAGGDFLSLDGGDGGERSDGSGYDSEEERATAWEAIQSRGHNTRHMKAKKLKGKHAAAIGKVASLSEARSTLSSSVAPPSASRVKGKLGGIMRSGSRLRAAPLMASRSSAPTPPGAPPMLATLESVIDHSLERSMAVSMARRAASGCASGCDSDSGASDDGWYSDGSCEDEGGLHSLGGGGGGGGGASSSGGCSGVRLETRALSFGQMSRIYGRQRKMGVL